MLFGQRLCIPRLYRVPQTKRNYRLICNSMASPSGGDSLLPLSCQDTPDVNVSTDRTVAPLSMQLRPYPSRLLQQIWEADPLDGLVYMSKLDINDDFHCCSLRPFDAGAFSYVVPTLPSDKDIYLCVDLVLPMVWVISLPFFCAASETAVDLANSYMSYHGYSTREYVPTSGFYLNVPPPHFRSMVA